MRTRGNLLAGVIVVAATAAHVRAETGTCPSHADATIVPVRVVAPAYPAVALGARVQGLVRIAVDIAPAGSVVATAACRGIPTLMDACDRAANQWRFPPANTGDKRTAIVNCRFILEDGETNAITYVAPLDLEIRDALPIVSIIN